ncbi:MAG: DUF4388 domain-containing protein [Longimicrobiales bacterium]
MAIEGPLRELSIQDVLQLLELARKTGVLSVRSEVHNDEGVVHFRRGRIVFGRRRRSRRFLGQQLLRGGKLTERELERGLELQRESPGRRLSEILLEMGSVDEAELREQLRFQIEETVYDLMAWTEGYFRFEDRADVFHSDILIEVRVESLLMEGARRVDEWSRLESKISSLDTVPVFAPAEDSTDITLDLKPEEWEVLAEIDGERDIRQIAADLGHATFDVGKVVYGLISTGVVTVLDRPARFSERELETRLAEARAQLDRGEAEQAVQVLTMLENAFPERVELAVLTGRALLAQGRARAATEAFDRAVGLDPLAPGSHYHLGFAAVQIGDLERAADAWEMYLRLSPEESAVRRHVSTALAAVRRLIDVIARSAGEIA